MRYFVPFACILCIALTFNSCKEKKEFLVSNNFYNPDSLSANEYDLNSIIYSVPSPHQISLLIRDDYPYYEEGLFKNNPDVKTYETSEKKALILGALCADFGYLSLYDQKELIIQYLDNIRYLVNASKLGNYNPTDLFRRIDKNLDNSDSIITIISEIMKNENEAIRTGERPYLSSLIIAGGWIESFYILNTLYNNSKNSNLFGILLQQQYVLENLIKSLRPYYNKSREFTELINKLVEIAYEYEVVDVNYKNLPVVNSDSITFIKCKFTPILSGSQLNKIFQLSESLRKDLIY